MQRSSWISKIEEDPETGDQILTLPPEMMEQLGWKEGDLLEFDVEGSTIIIRKIG